MILKQNVQIGQLWSSKLKASYRDLDQRTAGFHFAAKSHSLGFQPEIATPYDSLRGLFCSIGGLISWDYVQSTLAFQFLG